MCFLIAGLGKTTWEKIVLVNAKNPGVPFFTLAPTYQPDFPNGNFTLGEIPAALAAAGYTMNDLNDNSTYVGTEPVCRLSSLSNSRALILIYIYFHSMQICCDYSE
jgi:hypothetical protein